MRLRVWLRAARLPFLTGAAVPVLVGTVAAWHDTGGFAWVGFSLAMAGALLVHAGANLANDYFDHVSGNDAANPAPTPTATTAPMLAAPPRRGRSSLSRQAPAACRGRTCQQRPAGACACHTLPRIRVMG